MYLRFKMTIGVTGPSGAGKSYFCSLLAARGFCVLDCDKIYHGMISAPSDCTRELAESFGDRVLLPCGGIDRSALSDIVFSDPAALKKLDLITHKYVKAELSLLIEHSDAPTVIDAPQLFEAGCDSLCEATIGILAAGDERAARLYERDGGRRTRAQLDARINASLPDSFYLERCTYIFRNDHDAAALCAFADRIAELYGSNNDESSRATLQTAKELIKK